MKDLIDTNFVYKNLLYKDRCDFFFPPEKIQSRRKMKLTNIKHLPLYSLLGVRDTTVLSYLLSAACCF